MKTPIDSIRKVSLLAILLAVPAWGSPESPGHRVLPPDEIASRVDSFRADDPAMTVHDFRTTFQSPSEASLTIVGFDEQARTERRTDLHERIVHLSLVDGTWQNRGQVDTTFHADSSNLTYSSVSLLPASTTLCVPIHMSETTNLALAEGAIPWDVLWTDSGAASLRPALLGLAAASPELFVERADHVIEVRIGSQVFESINSGLGLEEALQSALIVAKAPCRGFAKCFHECFGLITTPLGYGDLLCLGIGAGACATAPPLFPGCMSAVFTGCGVAALAGEVAAVVACAVKCI